MCLFAEEEEKKVKRETLKRVGGRCIEFTIPGIVVVVVIR